MMPAKLFSQSIRLSELLDGIVEYTVRKDPRVTGLSLDSRTLKKGNVFIALGGHATHGIKYLTSAIKSGASAVLVEASPEIDISKIKAKIPLIEIDSLSEVTGEIAKRFYNNPSALMDVIAITGTNGKTSCANYLAQILSTKSACGVIGTVGNGIYPELQTATHTTPDIISTNKQLLDFDKQGAKSVVMEVSSHGIMQHRIDGIKFNVAVFTNISRDHLDYHGSMAEYFSAKARLFTEHKPGVAVINTDDRYGVELANTIKQQGITRLVTFGLNQFDSEQHLLIKDVQADISGLKFSLELDKASYQVATPLLGRFNVENVTAVIAATFAMGWDIENILPALTILKPASGRMQAFKTKNGAIVVVDYAHTPDALEKALKSLRGLTIQKLICVFGCGGNRDIGKRPQMGAIAEDNADEIILTNDNPRNESPLHIISDILMGIVNKNKVDVIPDRKTAIVKALNKAGEGDVVLVAGKGHESCQIIGNKKLDFSDIAVIKNMAIELEVE